MVITYLLTSYFILNTTIFYSKYIYIAIKYIYYYYNIEERNLKLLDSTKLLDFAKLLDARLFFFLLF